ncbi:hypothetical protein [Nocardioides terrigena]|uniref:hypothetical protein n=1 Tax=Nocardioides terrigena TaxID=424797 RepID=UPI000D305A47|nr:hypothetical protein [Nocardioides terrigena]
MSEQSTENDRTVGDVLATFVQAADPGLAADLRAAARAETAGNDARCFREWRDRNSVRVHICIGSGEHECYCGACGTSVIPTAKS